MIKFKNTLEYNKYRALLTGGRVGGVFANNSQFLGGTSYPLPSSRYLTANYHKFEKHIDDSYEDMSYHLSGYGLSFSEALVSFLGESAERYSLVSSAALLDMVITVASFAELSSRTDDLVLPLNYINVFYNNENPENFITEECPISWIKLKSLVDYNRDVYVPLQMFLPHSPKIFHGEKKFNPSGVSTGTSCNETAVESLSGAIIEYLQIDSFNLWWYGGLRARELNADMLTLLGEWGIPQGEVKRFLNNFRVNFLNISFDKAIPIIVCEIYGITDALPKYTVGVQGGYYVESVMYRAFMECLTVVEYNMNFPWIDPKKWLSIPEHIDDVHNLDDNVLWFARYGKPISVTHTKKNLMLNLRGGILQQLRTLSDYAGFLQITAPEFTGLNLEVTRVIIPELLPICLPSIPPIYHPRYAEVNGISNLVIHPLA